MSRLLAGLMLAMSILLTMAPAASAETRSLRLYFLHTKERAEITYKRNGRYIQSGLNQINHLLRDWRRNEPGNMDPRLLDLLWEVYRASGSRDYIHVVSAYRSPATNNMLRQRSSGVAQNSQHTHGKAIDFFLPDVKLVTLRNLGLRMQAGGVGYYPRSGSPFVHLDVGSVRHWPRMSRNELASVFPDGRTVHVPTDGKPMPGYQQALAAHQARQRSGGSIQIADDSSSSGRTRGRGLLATLFGGGGGADEEEDNQIAAAPAPARQAQAAQPQRQAQPQQTPQPPAPVAPQAETPATILAALPARDLPVPRAAPRPAVDMGTPLPVETPAPAAQEEEEVPAASQMALNVPLPSRRPERPASEPAIARAAPGEEEDEDAPLMATAYITPTPRPEPPRTSDVIAEILATHKEEPATETVASLTPAFVPVPRPREDAQPEMASASQSAPPAEQSDEVPSVAAVADAPAAIKLDPAEALPQMARADALPQMARLDRNALSSGTFTTAAVRTSSKAARPGPDDVRPGRKPMVLPIHATSANYVLSSESVIEKTQNAQVPAFSPEIASAPKAVYTEGFQRDPGIADARRFTGKAVTFLSVAKFGGN